MSPNSGARGGRAERVVHRPGVSSDPEYLTLSQAAQELGLSLSEAEKRVRRGQLPVSIIYNRPGVWVYLPALRAYQRRLDRQ